MKEQNADYTAIEDLEWSVRTANVLEQHGIRTVGHLARMNERQLLGLRNFTAKSLGEVRAVLGELGLTIGTRRRNLVIPAPQTPSTPDVFGSRIEVVLAHLRALQRSVDALRGEVAALKRQRRVRS